MNKYFTILASLIVFAMSQSIQNKSLGTDASSLPGENDKPSAAGTFFSMDIGYIYKLTLIEDTDSFKRGEIYIGQHAGQEEYYFASGKIIKRLIKKHGTKIFSREIICPDINTMELLCYLEEYYIGYYNCNRSKSGIGLNLTSGGENVKGYKYTEDVKLKLSQNLKEAYRSKKRIHPYQKTVYQYDLQTGAFIAEYESCRIAAEVVEGNSGPISICASGRGYSAFGFGWSYTKVEKYRMPKLRGVVQLDKSGNVVNTYPTLQQASNETGISDTAICNCCRSSTKTSGGFRWKYQQESFGVKYAPMRAVCQYSLSGDFIQKHRSTVSAAKDLGISRKVVNRICEGRYMPNDPFKFYYTQFKK